MTCANCKELFVKKTSGYYRHSLNIKCASLDITVCEALEKMTGVTFEEFTDIDNDKERKNENKKDPVKNKSKSRKRKLKSNESKSKRPKVLLEGIEQNEPRKIVRKKKEVCSTEIEPRRSSRKKQVEHTVTSEPKPKIHRKKVQLSEQNEKEKRKLPSHFLCSRCYTLLSDCVRYEKAIRDFWGRHQEDSYIGERRGVHAAECLVHDDYSYATEEGLLPNSLVAFNAMKTPNYEAKRPKYTGPVKKVRKGDTAWQVVQNKNNKWDTLVTAIRARQYRRAAKKFYYATKGSRKGFLTVVGIVARQEIRKLLEDNTKFSMCSVTDVPNTTDFWNETFDQMMTAAPLLYTVLRTSVTSRKTEATLIRGNTNLKPQLGVALACLIHTRAPKKLNSIAKYLSVKFWQKRMQCELGKKPLLGKHNLCDNYSRDEILQIRREFLTAETVTQQMLEEEIMDNRMDTDDAMEVEDLDQQASSDSNTEDIAQYHKMAGLKKESSVKMFDGFQEVYSHESKECKCSMKFGVYLPKKAANEKCPVLYWLSGLTCTEQNFVTKAGAQRVAAEKEIIIVAPDTSPRGVNIEGEDDSYDFGSGAGFYVDATEEKWKTNYRMYSYIVSELPGIINSNFKTNPEQISIFGHSMGGHGALICAMKNPGMYKSVSAFAPISNPIEAPWGVKAFTGYLGADKSKWQEYDATELVKKYKGPALNILVDQGESDNFYTEKQLLPDHLEAACKSNKVPLQLRIQEGYDHSYYFIATFVEDHINHHAKFLCQ